MPVPHGTAGKGKPHPAVGVLGCWCWSGLNVESTAAHPGRQEGAQPFRPFLEQLGGIYGHAIGGTLPGDSACLKDQFTSVRVVCNNTLQLAIGDRANAVKVPHSTKFDPVAVKDELGLCLSAWDSFLASMRGMADRPVNKFEAMKYLVEVLGDRDVPLADQPNQKALQSVYALFAGAGKGSALVSADGTAWGLLNAVTEYVDHARRARNQDYRLDSAWFGQGAQIKGRALEQAMQLIA